MQIGQLSRETGVSVRMLRYYEQAELLRPARRASGYRSYGEEDAAIVRRIVLLNRAGLGLKTIRGVLACALPAEDGAQPCAALQQSVAQKLAELEAQIDALSESRALLLSILSPGS